MSALRFLITGGSQGIGAALVEVATKAGHKVVFTGRNQPAIDAMCRQTGAVGVRADVAVAEDNARTVETCMQQMGGVDVLVNNAAFDYRAEIGALDVGRMKTLFDTNVFGLVDITNRVVPQMKERQSGEIINIASTSGMKGARGGDAVCREQVGGARHLAVLAGGASAARHSRDLRLPIRSADQLRRQDRPQQPEQALCERYRRDDHRGARHASSCSVA